MPISTSFVDVMHSILPAFVKRLQNEIDGLQQKIQDHNQTLNQLQVQQPTYTSPDSFTSYNPNSWYNVFTSLREALQHLADQVLQVRRVLEEVLQAMKNVSPETPLLHLQC